MFSILRVKLLLALFLSGTMFLAGCQNLADISADHYAGELPPQTEKSE